MLSDFLAKLKSYFTPSRQFGLRVGRLFGVNIWLHWFLLLFGSLHLVFYLLPLNVTPSPFAHFLVVYVLVLPFSLLTHEFAHAFVAYRQGGGAEKLVLLPVGGMVPCKAPSAPMPQLWVAVAGTLANLVLLIVAGSISLAAHWTLFPGPEQADEFIFERVLIQNLFLWNAFLIIVNLVPCVPMDMGKVAQALLWRKYESLQHAVIVSLQSSKIISIVSMVLGGAIFLWSLGSKQFMLEHPLLNILIMGFLFVGFLHIYESRKLQQEAEHQEEEEAGIFGYDFSQGYTSLEKSLPEYSGEAYSTSSYKQVETARGERAERKEQEEQEIRDRVDVLLTKIHDEGMESLSREEKRFLKKASKHYRA